MCLIFSHKFTLILVFLVICKQTFILKYLIFVDQQLYDFMVVYLMESLTSINCCVERLLQQTYYLDLQGYCTSIIYIYHLKLI